MEYAKGDWEVYRGHNNFFMDEPYILAPRDLSKPEISRPDKCVAIVKFITKEQTEANAHLIASAPALYEALKGMLEWARLTDSGDTGEWADKNDPDIVQANKALAKAEGKLDKPN